LTIAGKARGDYGSAQDDVDAGDLLGDGGFRPITRVFISMNNLPSAAEFTVAGVLNSDGWRP